jgi:DNA-binding beta-propeller fold protein YncE
LLAAIGFAYFTFGWMFFVRPHDGGENLNLSITHVAGSHTGEKGYADGMGSMARMNKPIRLAPLNDTIVVFADIFNHAIRTICLDGSVKTLAGGPEKMGYQDGDEGQAKFHSPHGVAVRTDGVIAVAEVENNTIRLLTPGNTDSVSRVRYTVSTLAGKAGKKGMQDGRNEDALFDAPHAVSWGPEGELYIADIGNSRIRMIRDGITSTVAGRDEKGKKDGNLETGTLKYPMDISIDKLGNLWIVDAGTMTVRKWNKNAGLTTPFPGLELAMPHGISIIADKSIVVAELYGHRILKIDLSTGKKTTLCGTTEKGIGKGRLYKPAAVLVYHNDIWVADMGNHRIVRTSLPN